MRKKRKKEIKRRKKQQQPKNKPRQNKNNNNNNAETVNEIQANGEDNNKIVRDLDNVTVSTYTTSLKSSTFVCIYFYCNKW